MPPVAISQVSSALSMIKGEDGTTRGASKIAQLRRNADFFRRGLELIGCHTLGDYGSPVIPILAYTPAKISWLSRFCHEQGVGIVIVGFPATSLLGARVRVCISA